MIRVYLLAVEEHRHQRPLSNGTIFEASGSKRDVIRIPFTEAIVNLVGRGGFVNYRSHPMAVFIPTGGSNTVSFEAQPGSIANYGYQFYTSAGAATVTPPTPFDSSADLTVSVPATDDDHRLEVGVTDPIAKFDIVARKAMTRSVLLVPVKLVDGNGRPVFKEVISTIGGGPVKVEIPAGVPPNPTDLGTLLNSIYGPECNCTFSVRVHPSVVTQSYVHDSNGGYFYDKNNPPNDPIFNLLEDLLRTGANPVTDDFIIFVVDSFAPYRGGKLQGQTFDKGGHSLGSAVCATNSSLRTYPHEIGHIFGLEHPFENIDSAGLSVVPDSLYRRLMTWEGPGFTAATRMIKPEWRTVNRISTP